MLDAGRQEQRSHSRLSVLLRRGMSLSTCAESARSSLLEKSVRFSPWYLVFAGQRTLGQPDRKSGCQRGRKGGFEG